MAFSDRQLVEVFHLHLLRLLVTGPEKAHIALKGGSNLRFFFGSIRYSEDADLDVAVAVPEHVLRDKMNRLLSSSALAVSLKSSGIEIGSVSAPKQTPTTQRWKVGLRVAQRSLELRTKIEFSRRPTTEEAVLESPDPAVLQAYQMLPMLIRHYPIEVAMRQKVRALVGRRVTQARDVFDLAVLLARSGGNVDMLSTEQALLPQAIERAMDISYDDFQGQVVAYLEPTRATEFSSREAWDVLQLQVTEALEKRLR